MFNKFLQGNGMKLEIEYQDFVSNPFDDTPRGQRAVWFKKYQCVLKRGRKRFTFPFYVGEGWEREPNADDVMESLQLDCQSGSMDFAEFCSDFGYDEDSRRAEKVWKACVKTTKGIVRVMGTAFEDFMYLDINDTNYGRDEEE